MLFIERSILIRNANNSSVLSGDSGTRLWQAPCFKKLSCVLKD